MHTLPHPNIPDDQTCEQARLSRDPRFDGLFVVAVTTTKVFCRPMCPAPTPKPENVRYFGNAAEAVSKGYRPCLRCRPELAPLRHLWHRSDALAHRAVTLVEQHDPVADSVSSLSKHLGTSARHLHRVFTSQFGTTPHTFIATRRLLFAKQLLSETDLPVGDVAFASGFGSVRRFNDAIQLHFRLTPSQIRQRAQSEQDTSGAQGVTLLMPYRPPYAFVAQLEFYAARALPGLECVSAGAYERVFASRAGLARLRVSEAPSQNALRVQLHNVDARDLADVYARVRRMFDLDAEPSVIETVLNREPLLKASLKRHAGLRIPGAFDPFEIGVRAILGQQVSVAGARTLATRVLQQFGTRPSKTIPADAPMLFPGAERLAEASMESIGMPSSRAKAVNAFARAVADFEITFRMDQKLDQFVAQLCELPGIGEWTAHYIAARCLHHPDAFPAGDLILRRAFAGKQNDSMSARALEEQSQAWRPWRAYAMFHAWRGAAD